MIAQKRSFPGELAQECLVTLWACTTTDSMASKDAHPRWTPFSGWKLASPSADDYRAPDGKFCSCFELVERKTIWGIRREK